MSLKYIEIQIVCFYKNNLPAEYTNAMIGEHTNTNHGANKAAW